MRPVVVVVAAVVDSLVYHLVAMVYLVVVVVVDGLVIEVVELCHLEHLEMVVYLAVVDWLTSVVV